MAKTKDTFKAESFQVRKGELDLPDDLSEDIKSRGWVHRWLNAKQLQQSGGHDTRGWMAYRIPDSLRQQPKPGVYIEGADYKNSIDGFYRRGDLILGVMPEVKQRAMRAESRRVTKAQEDLTSGIRRRHREVSVEQAEKYKGSIAPNPEDILED